MILKKEIKLYKKDLDFLIQKIKNPAVIKVLLKVKNEKQLKKNKEDRKISIFLASNDIELIADFLSNLLVNEGLQENDEPNSVGLYIEELIDIFNPYGN